MENETPNPWPYIGIVVSSLAVTVIIASFLTFVTGLSSNYLLPIGLSLAVLATHPISNFWIRRMPGKSPITLRRTLLVAVIIPVIVPIANFIIDRIFENG